MALTTAGNSNWVRDYIITFTSTTEFVFGITGVTEVEIKSEDQQFPLDIDFKVSYEEGTGMLELNILGLQEDTISKISKKTIVKLSAGYRGKKLPLLFSGEVRAVSTKRPVGKLVTTVKAMSIPLASYPFYANEPEKFSSYLDRIFWALDVSRSMTGGILEVEEGKDMLRNISESEIEARKISDRKGVLFDQKPLLSYAPADGRTPHSGSVELVLSKVLMDHQIAYYLVNDSLLFYKKGTANPNDSSNATASAIALELGKNLLTVPAIIMDNSSVNKFDPVTVNSYQMKAMLTPDVKPGVSIVTDFFREASGEVVNKKKVMIVEEVTHTGNTASKAWHSMIKADLSESRIAEPIAIKSSIDSQMQNSGEDFKSLDQLTGYNVV